MKPQRLGGALLASVATGIGIMVPYTLKTIAAPIMAVIWAVLVFVGLIGAVLALRPDNQIPNPGPGAIPAGSSRKPLIDPDLMAVIAIFFGVPIAIMTMMLIQRVFFHLIQIVGS